jgi:hypothetical protein
MPSRQTFVAATFIVLTSLGLTLPGLVAGEPKGAAAADDPFAGKVLIVAFTQGDKHGSAVMEKATVKRLGERSFLVGVGIDEWNEDRWAHGVTVWMPLDKIGNIYAVDNVDQVKKIFGKIRP